MKLTDAEKTRRLAEGCMGWGWDTSTRLWMAEEDGEICNAEDEYWSPLANESHAAEVRERMRELGWETQLTYGTIKDWAGVNDCKGTQFLRHGKRGTMTRVSSEVSLLALGLAKEEEL